MRLYRWLDDDGYLRQVLLRNDDLDDNKDYGIPFDPPSLTEFNIPEAVKKDLHNELVDRGLISQADVLAQQSGVTGAVEKIGRRHNLKQTEVRQLRRDLLIAYRR